MLLDLSMHSLVDSYMRPDQGSNSNPSTSGPCSNQLNYLARAYYPYFTDEEARIQKGEGPDQITGGEPVL